MKYNLPKNISGLGLDTALWMYEGDRYFYHDYFSPYRTSVVDDELAIPKNLMIVSQSPVMYSENVPETETETETQPKKTDKEMDILKYLSIGLIVMDKIL